MKRKNIIFLVVLIAIICGAIYVTAPINAIELDPAKNLSAAGEPGLQGKSNLPALVGMFINVFLSIIGIVFVALLIYGGFVYMTAAGEKERVTKGTNIIRQSVIGLVIVVSSYAISTFVINSIAKGPGTTPTP